MSVLPVYMYVHYMCSWCLRWSDEGIGSSTMWLLGIEPESSTKAINVIHKPLIYFSNVCGVSEEI